VSEILSTLNLLVGKILNEIIFAIYISYISVTILFTVLFKTQEHDFKAEDVFHGDYRSYQWPVFNSNLCTVVFVSSNIR